VVERTRERGRAHKCEIDERAFVDKVMVQSGRLQNDYGRGQSKWFGSAVQLVNQPIHFGWHTAFKFTSDCKLLERKLLTENDDKVA
jgi:hypothetical protein